MIERIEPSWKVDSAFINEHLSSAFALDSLRSSHPVEVACPDEDHIAQIFDAVSYSKGGSVLRMLSNVIGEDVFLKGVSIYLKKHLYANAQTKDLWDGISEASEQDVAAFMLNWTTKVRCSIQSSSEVTFSAHILPPIFRLGSPLSPSTRLPRGSRLRRTVSSLRAMSSPKRMRLFGSFPSSSRP